MNLKLKISENFSKAAGAYDDHALIQKQVARNLVLRSYQYLATDSRILDIGSGTGFIARSLDRKITQADIALGMCKKSADISPSICADIENLPFSNSSFDATFSSSSLQWLDNIDHSFSEICRVLDKSGYFFFTIFGGSTLKELKSSQQYLNISSKIHKFSSYDQLENSLKKTGFQVISYEKEYHTMQHDSTRELFRSIKNIGAGASFSSERPITKASLIKLEDFYRKNYLKENCIYSTWEVLYFICRK